MNKLAGLERRINRLKFSLLHKLGFYLKHLSQAGGDYILEFHGLDKVGSDRFNWRFIKEDDFKRLILFLNKVGQIVSLDEIHANTQDKELRFALTFDDGYQTLKDALYWLNSRKIPATVFLTPNETTDKILWTDLLDILRIETGLDHVSIEDKRFIKENKSFVDSVTKEDLNHFLKRSSKRCIQYFIQSYKIDQNLLRKYQDYWKLLNFDDLRDLSKCAYLDIQSHGVSHTSMDQLSEAELTLELANSRSWIEKATGNVVDKVAFPAGKANDHVVEICRKMNYKVLLTEGNNFNNENLKPRIGLYNNGGFYFILEQLSKAVQ